MRHCWTLSFFFCPFLVWYEPQSNSMLVWLHYLHSGVVLTLLWRPLGVSVVLTWHQHGLDNKWYLSNAALSVHYLCYLCLCLSSFLVISLSDSRCPCLWYDCIFSFYYSCFLALILQLRLIRYAVPLVLIGCLYYKVCHLLSGLHYIHGLIMELSQFEPTVRWYQKTKYLEWKFGQKMTTGSWIIWGKWSFISFLFFLLGNQSVSRSALHL